MSGLIDRTTLILSKALDGLTAQQSVISGNLANIDTPGYQPKTVDFQTELARMVNSDFDSSAQGLPNSAGPSADQGMKRTDPRHFSANGTVAGAPSYTTSTTNENLRNDTNTVDLETEMTALTQTQIKYEADARLISGKFGQINDVLGGR
jgi:flagellar basal-body rod protein FlgB